MSAVSYRIRAAWGPCLAIILLYHTPIISSLENAQNMLQKELKEARFYIFEMKQLVK